MQGGRHMIRPNKRYLSHGKKTKISLTHFVTICFVHQLHLMQPKVDLETRSGFSWPGSDNGDVW